MTTPSFSDYQSGALNEAKASFNGMNYVVTVFTDMSGCSIQFIPDSKTLEKFPKTEQVDNIMSRLKKGMPDFASTLNFVENHPSAGLVFQINKYDLADTIVKAIK